MPLGERPKKKVLAAPLSSSPPAIPFASRLHSKLLPNNLLENRVPLLRNI